MKKINKILAIKYFMLALSVLSLVIISVISVAVLLFNSDEIVKTPKQVLLAHRDAFYARDIEGVALTLYPKGSQEYINFMQNSEDWFDEDFPPYPKDSSIKESEFFYPLSGEVIGFENNLVGKIISFKMYPDIHYGNMQEAQAILMLEDENKNIHYASALIPFKKIDGRWYLHESFSDYSLVDYPGIVKAMQNPYLDKVKPLPNTFPLRLNAAQKTEYSTNNGQYKTHIVKENEYIDWESFIDCAYLHEIVLPSNTNYIDPNNFLQLTSLTAIKFDGESSLFTALDGVVYNKDMTTLVLFPRGKGAAQGSPQGEFHIPNTVTTIGEKAFMHYEGQIKKIVFPSSVKVIGDGAFRHAFNTSDYSVELNDGLEKIGASAFDSVLLSQITIPQSVTEIGNEAFINAANLYQINFHQNSALKALALELLRMRKICLR
ncbi:MAG: leucine-rich repeat domain-containing protein [Clostridia bacterium]